MSYQNYTTMSNMSSGSNYSANDFQRKAQAIAYNIQKISQNVTSMTRYVSQLPSTAPEANANSELRSQLHKVTHYTGQLAKDTNDDLKELNRVNLASLLVSSNELRQMKLQREKLVQDFTNVLNSFQAIQRSSATKEKEVLKAMSKKGTDEDFLLGPPQRHDPNSAMKQAQLLEEDVGSVEELREREQAIRQLESDILNVNQIFKELATMVHEQGEVVDSIEAHVEASQIQVEEGTRHLGQAVTYQERKRRRYFYMLAVITALIVLALILLKIFD